MKNWVALVLLFVSGTSVADDSAVYLPKDKPAPFTGYLLTEEKAKKVVDLSIDLDSQKRVNALLMEENKVLEERVSNARKHVDHLSKALTESQDTGFFTKAGYFVLGAIVTGAIAYGTVQTLR